jgi:propanediol dehydratase small subunit
MTPEERAEKAAELLEINDYREVIANAIREAVLAEREECAKLCDSISDRYWGDECAGLIRGRGK